MKFLMTRTAILDYASLARITEAEARAELERRVQDANEVRRQDNGLTVYRLKGSHHGNRYRVLVAQDGSVTRVLPEHARRRRIG
jgi:hypothetical protein